jgi:hypothetical protein
MKFANKNYSKNRLLSCGVGIIQLSLFPNHLYLFLAIFL